MPGEVNWGESGDSAARREVRRRLALRGVVTAVGETVAALTGLDVALRSVGMANRANWLWNLEVSEIGRELGKKRVGLRGGKKGRDVKGAGARERRLSAPAPKSFRLRAGTAA